MVTQRRRPLPRRTRTTPRDSLARGRTEPGPEQAEGQDGHHGHGMGQEEIGREHRLLLAEPPPAIRLVLGIMAAIGGCGD